MEGMYLQQTARSTVVFCLAMLLVSCVSLDPVADTWPKRYKVFLEQEAMPFDRRLKTYLGLKTGQLAGVLSSGTATFYRDSDRNAIWSMTVHLEPAVDGIYTGSMGSGFSPATACISQSQLSEVGQYVAGLTGDIHVQSATGPGYLINQMEPDHLIFKLQNGKLVDSQVTMEQGCLTSISHKITLR